MKILYIIRGLPGSGKSTYAQALAKRLGIKHYEADMYFLDKEGNYNFDAKKLGAAHSWCLDQVDFVMHGGDSVIVSNTFTMWREIEPYVIAAFEEDFSVKIVQMNGRWNTIHGVPEETMKKMAARFVDNKLLPHFSPRVHDIDYSEVY